MARSTTPSQLLRLAVPLIPAHGFTLQTLHLASRSLLNAPSSGFSPQTLSALFPSPPPRHRGPFAPLTGRRSWLSGAPSLSREDLVREAKGELGEGGEPVGPVRALVGEWLAEGRRAMVESVLAEGGKGQIEARYRAGLRERVRYNEQVLDMLPEVSEISEIQDVTMHARGAKLSGGELTDDIWLPAGTRHPRRPGRLHPGVGLERGPTAQPGTARRARRQDRS